MQSMRQLNMTQIGHCKTKLYYDLDFGNVLFKASIGMLLSSWLAMYYVVEILKLKKN